MIVGRVAEIFRFPVKSMGGERLPRVEVGPQGVPGDRAWAVRDETRGGIRGAKKIPALMGCRARYARGRRGPAAGDHAPGRQRVRGGRPRRERAPLRGPRHQGDPLAAAAGDRAGALPPRAARPRRRDDRAAGDLRPRARRAAARPLEVPARPLPVRVAARHLLRRRPPAAAHGRDAPPATGARAGVAGGRAALSPELRDRVAGECGLPRDRLGGASRTHRPSAADRSTSPARAA